MTRTDKAVTRVTTGQYPQRTGASGRGYGKARAIVVTIGPGDMLTLRPLGTQQREFISIEHLYRIAVSLRVRSDAMQKINARRRGRRA
jgi:hypothetical protein